MTALRRLTFSVFAAGGGSIERSGTLVDLVAELPVLSAGLIPPLHVLNDLLRLGRDDAGMSGGAEWEPIQIDKSEWRALVTALERGGQQRAWRFVHPPEW